jgi:hypothetical protein
VPLVPPVSVDSVKSAKHWQNQWHPPLDLSFDSAVKLTDTLSQSEGKKACSSNEDQQLEETAWE